MKPDSPVNTPAPTKEPGAAGKASAANLPQSAPLNETEQERLHRLGLELRCLVCQNQSIADSNSGLAVDLRRQMTEQMQAGRSDAEIKQYMVERYGDFVLYKPAFSMSN